MSEKKMKAAAEMSYEEAIADLDAILEELEAEESDLDSLAERVKRASELVKHCRQKIQATEVEVSKVLEELPAVED
jgi:exodeoxyribonuclease VII small subunit